MMLEDKVAVVYGAGGAIGGAVARAFAAEGADGFVTGRDLAAVEAVAKDIGPPAGPRRGGRSTRSTSGRSTSTCSPSSTARAASTSRSTRSGSRTRTIARRPAGRPRRRAVRAADRALHDVVLPHRAPGGPADAPDRIGRDHDRHRAPLADRHPARRRLRPGAGRQGGAHARACPPSSRRTASASSACARRRCRRRSRSGEAFEPRAEPGLTWEQFQELAGQQDPPAAADDARRDGEDGGVHGIRPGERHDGDNGQPDHGRPGRLKAGPSDGHGRKLQDRAASSVVS